jgi:hypothetical protein
MGLAMAWSIGVIWFYLGYHLPEPHGTITVTTGGHTYVGHDGNPPALTLFQRDATSFKLLTCVIVVALLVGTVDLAIRTYRRSISLGIAAVVAGGSLILFSLFGLVYGLLGIGPIGALIILSGLPMRSKHSLVRA